MRTDNCPAFKKAGAHKRTIAVDLDDTLFHNSCFPDIGRPLEGAVEIMQELKNLGYYLIIHTARLSEDYPLSWNNQLRLIQFALTTNKIPFDEIWQGRGKPVTCSAIDDISFKNLKEFVGSISENCFGEGI